MEKLVNTRRPFDCSRLSRGLFPLCTSFIIARQIFQSLCLFLTFSFSPSVAMPRPKKHPAVNKLPEPVSEPDSATKIQLESVQDLEYLYSELLSFMKNAHSLTGGKGQELGAKGDVNEPKKTFFVGNPVQDSDLRQVPWDLLSIVPGSCFLCNQSQCSDSGQGLDRRHAGGGKGSHRARYHKLLTRLIFSHPV